jgi:hypothetical protein
MDDASAADERRTDRGRALWLIGLTAAALVLLFAVMPHTVSADGGVRFLKLDALLRHGTLGGERFSFVGPLFAAPFWLLGDPNAILWWCARFNVLVLAAGCAVAWWALAPALPAAERAAFLLALAAAGMMPNAVRDFYGELFSAVTIATGLLIVSVRRRWFGWIAVIAGVANMPAAGVGLALAAMTRAWKDRRFDGLIALAAAAALVALENQFTRGGLLNSGYFRDHGFVTILPFSGKAGFSYPMVLGVPALLLSFGKGVLFFAPALLLVAHARRHRPALAGFFDLSMVLLAGLLLVYSQWWAWYGGWTWGPRFLLYAAYPSALALAIAVMAPAAPARSTAIVAIAAWTVWVGVSGAVFDLEGLETCIANGYALEHLCWFVPEFSPLFRHLAIPPSTLAPWQQTWMLFAAVVAAVLLTSGPSLPGIAGGLQNLLRSRYQR